MIQIIYTATTNIEDITAEDKEQMMKQIINELKDKLNKSVYVFQSFSYQKSKHLKNDIVIFNCLIDAVPPQRFLVKKEKLNPN